MVMFYLKPKNYLLKFVLNPKSGKTFKPLVDYI